MKLKTLKDLELFTSDERRVKAEAIKWVKRIDKGYFYTDKGRDYDLTLIGWIKEFFNLTEQDLKSCKEVKDDES